MDHVLRILRGLGAFTVFSACMLAPILILGYAFNASKNGNDIPSITITVALVLGVAWLFGTPSDKSDNKS